MNIFQNESDSERQVANRQYGNPTSRPTTSTSTTKDDTNSNGSIDEKSSLRIIDHKVVDSDDSKNTFYPIPFVGKRAHVTLGTSERVRPVSTGIDLLDAVHHEKLASEGKLVPETYSLPGSTSKLRCYNPGLWVLYPDTHLEFESMFTGHY
jgi:hypothetical protein